jgi:hypothetical protein
MAAAAAAGKTLPALRRLVLAAAAAVQEKMEHREGPAGRGGSLLCMPRQKAAAVAAARVHPLVLVLRLAR